MNSIFSNNDELDPRLKETVFIVEATSYERHSLYSFCKQALPKMPTWEQQSGTKYQVSWLGKRPVVIDVFWVKINNKLVLFYEGSSEVVDHKAIEKWFDKNCNPKRVDGKNARTDANNFHICLHSVMD